MNKRVLEKIGTPLAFQASVSALWVRIPSPAPQNERL